MARIELLAETITELESQGKRVTGIVERVDGHDVEFESRLMPLRSR